MELTNLNAEQKKLNGEQNPTFVNDMVDLRKKVVKLFNTLISLFPPQGYTDHIMKSLVQAESYLDMALEPFGMMSPTDKIDDSGITEVDEDVLFENKEYLEVYGDPIRRLKTLRLELLSIILKLDSLADVCLVREALPFMSYTRNKLYDAEVSFRLAMRTLYSAKIMNASNLITLDGTKIS